VTSTEARGCLRIKQRHLLTAEYGEKSTRAPTLVGSRYWYSSAAGRTNIWLDPPVTSTAPSFSKVGVGGHAQLSTVTVRRKSQTKWRVLR
jgi:hypothetical protein